MSLPRQLALQTGLGAGFGTLGMRSSRWHAIDPRPVDPEHHPHTHHAAPS